MGAFARAGQLCWNIEEDGAQTAFEPCGDHSEDTSQKGFGCWLTASPEVTPISRHQMAMVIPRGCGWVNPKDPHREAASFSPTTPHATVLMMESVCG